MKFPKIKIIIKGHTKIEIINIANQIVRETGQKVSTDLKGKENL